MSMRLQTEVLRVWIPTNRKYKSGKPAGMDGFNEIIKQNRSGIKVASRCERENITHCAWYIRKAMTMAEWQALTKDTACVCSVYMNHIEPNRQRDVPNVYAASKYVLDALTARHRLGCGAIYDDSVRWLDHFTQKVSVNAQEPGIELVIIRRYKEVQDGPA